MRLKASRVCNVPGCPDFVVYRGRCDEHRPQRGSMRAAGYGGKWEKTRAEFLKGMDFCNDCGSRERLQVHHIDGLGPKGPRGHDPFNLETLCHSCHSRRTRAESVS